MKNKKSFKVRVMKYAHQLFKSTGNEWRECIIKAWQLYRLADNMRNGLVKFSYQKLDGTLRFAVGTLQGTSAGISVSGKKKTKPSYKIFSYFDIDKCQYRCFKVENFITQL